jgi:uncharacterized delta-60 repeat protein
MTHGSFEQTSLTVEALVVRFLVLVVMCAPLAGCWRVDPLFCDSQEDCADNPGRTFCDLEGEYEASEHIARTCIAPPAPAAEVDLLIVTSPPLVRRGEQFDVSVRITRRNTDADVLVGVAAVEGFESAPVTVAAGQSEGLLSIRTGTDAPIGDTVLQLTATVGEASTDATVTTFVAGIPGALDTRFGDRGVLRLGRRNISAEVRSVAPQGDALIVVRQGPLIERYNSLGALDTTFGVDGHAAIDLAPLGFMESRSVFTAFDRDGGLIVAGHALLNGTDDAYVFRLTPDGQVDPRLTPRRLSSRAAAKYVHGVYSSQDGAILVAGQEIPAGGTATAVVWRMEPGHEAARMEVPNLDDCMLFIQRDGAMLSQGPGAPSVIRTRTNGQRDLAFGGMGELKLPRGNDVGRTWCRGAAYSQGRIVLANYASHGQVQVWRIHETGMMDATFGVAGLSEKEYDVGGARFQDVTVEDDGDIIVLASFFTYDTYRSYPILVRVDANGVIDDGYADIDSSTVDSFSAVSGGAFADGWLTFVTGTDDEDDISKTTWTVRRYWR